MPPMVDTRDWCDVDSDEDFCIPELPPLPEMVQCQIFPESPTPVIKREEISRIVNHKNPWRFRIDNAKESSPKTKVKSVKSSEYVCFVGKFPNQTSISELKSFIKSNGISFTGIRLGPKKKPNVNAFGYVDLLTRQDYEKLLSLDGTLYRGRAIRVDHATKKDTSSKASRMKKLRPRNKEFEPVSTPPLRQRKAYKRRGVVKKADVQRKKAGARFQRSKMQRNQKIGTRKKQYSKVLSSPAPKKNIRYRLEALPQK
jgi:hypothetical protein